MSDSDDEPPTGMDMFQEPADFCPRVEKKPTFQRHVMRDGTELSVRLVGHNPLWVRMSCASALRA